MAMVRMIRWGVRGQLKKRGIEQVIPPRKDAVIKQHGNSKEPRLERDEAVRNIRKYGRKGWKRHMGYHRSRCLRRLLR